MVGGMAQYCGYTAEEIAANRPGPLTDEEQEKIQRDRRQRFAVKELKIAGFGAHWLDLDGKPLTSATSHENPGRAPSAPMPVALVNETIAGKELELWADTPEGRRLVGYFWVRFAEHNIVSGITY
jgi:hypothetical protein